MPTGLLPAAFRSRLALLFGLLALLVGLPAYYYVSAIHRGQLIDDRRESLQALATATAAVVAENLVERRREIELLARTPLYRTAPLDSPEFQASLERLRDSYPHYSWLGLADATGSVRAASAGHLLGVDVAQRPWFDGGRKGIFAGDLHDAKLLAKLLAPAETAQPLRFIDFSAPVHDASGNLRGVLGAHIHWRWAASVMAVVKPHRSGETGLDLFIVNRAGEIIFPEGEHARIRPPAAAAAGSDAGARFQHWDDGRTYMTAAAAIREPVPATPLGWRIVVRQPETTLLADVARLQEVVLLTSIGAGLAFLVLAWLAASGISRPLERLTAHAKRLERGDESVSFEVPGDSEELRRLTAALQRMAGKLLESKHALEARVAERTEALVRLNRELEALARSDALTGIANRLAANERLAHEFARFRRSGEAYVLLVMDIDFFKRVNDTHGHAVGDAVLRHVAATIRSRMRETDFLARIGGEEFLALLPATPLADALGVAEKIRAAVAETPLAPVGKLSVSIGAAAATATDNNEEEAMRRADDFLYRAKEGGRNRVMPPPDGS